MPSAKTLKCLIHDRRFRARRHQHLLAGPVLPWPELAEIQSRFVATEHPLERRAIAVEFQRAVSNRGDSGYDDTAGGMTDLDRILAMPPMPYNPARNRADAERFARALRARDLVADGLSPSEVAESLG